MRVRIFALTLSLLFSLTAFGQSARSTEAREAARQQLAQKGFKFDEATFIKTIIDGDAATVNQFLAAGMNPSATDEDNVPALFWAIRKGHDEIALALINSGTDVSLKTEDAEDTALMIAAGCGRAEVAEALLAKGANIEAKDKGGHTALITALFGYGFRILSDKFRASIEQFVPGFKEKARQCMDTGDGHQRTIQLLLAKGANVNARATDGGETPLFIAGLFASTEMVRTLLAHGVNVNAKTWDDMTTLKWMQMFTSEMLKNDPEFKNNQVMVEWVAATAADRAEIVRLLKQAGAKEE